MSQRIQETNFNKREQTNITRKQQEIQMHIINNEQELKL